jgi:hypothetical protein
MYGSVAQQRLVRASVDGLVARAATEQLDGPSELLEPLRRLHSPYALRTASLPKAAWAAKLLGVAG